MPLWQFSMKKKGEMTHYRANAALNSALFPFAGRQKMACLAYLKGLTR